MDQVSMGSLFLEGLLSFFSPCVLPLIPLYAGYLTKESKVTDSEGNTTYARGRTFLMTLAFVLGICTVFILAGIGSGILHDFFTENALLFQLISGMVLVFFGLFATGLIQIPLLERTWRMNVAVTGSVGFLKAWVMGFLFSFAWSPCIGPMLAQAIVLAASAADKMTGWMYIASYAAGFVLIFLLIGLFTNEVLNFLKKYRNAVKYTGVIAGIAVLSVGIWTLGQGFAKVNALTHGEPVADTETEETAEPSLDTMNVTLTDAQGMPCALSDFKGKAVILNFFGTWCYYCNEELPGLQQIHEQRDDVTILLIAAPGVNGEGDEEYVEKFMKEAGYSMKILYDTSLQATRMFGVSSYPTSFIVKPDGTFLGYIPGYADEATLNSAIDQAVSEQ